MIDAKLIRAMSRIAILGVMAMAICCVSAVAQSGGGSGGSGGSGGGSGGGGGSTTITSNVVLSNLVAPFHGGLPTGQVTYTYGKSSTFKSMTINLTNVQVEDNDTVLVEIDDAVRVSNWISHSYSWVPVTIVGGCGVLSYNSANGDIVPFLVPTAGTTTITVWGDYTTWPGTTELATGTPILYGTFGALTRG